jgi:hypothetical protein
MIKDIPVISPRHQLEQLLSHRSLGKASRSLLNFLVLNIALPFQKSRKAAHDEWRAGPLFPPAKIDPRRLEDRPGQGRSYLNCGYCRIAGLKL